MELEFIDDILLAREEVMGDRLSKLDGRAINSQEKTIRKARKRYIPD